MVYDVDYLFDLLIDRNLTDVWRCSLVPAVVANRVKTPLFLSDARSPCWLIVGYGVSNESLIGAANQSALTTTVTVYMMKIFVVVVVVVVALTLTRIIKAMVTGQASVTLEWRNTPRKKAQTKPKVVHAYAIADAIHASARKI